MDIEHRVIDLTDAALARYRAERESSPSCERCGTTGLLYRLIGTAEQLCEHCFADVHVS